MMDDILITEPNWKFPNYEPARRSLPKDEKGLRKMPLADFEILIEKDIELKINEYISNTEESLDGPYANPTLIIHTELESFSKQTNPELFTEQKDKIRRLPTALFYQRLRKGKEDYLNQIRKTFNKLIPDDSDIFCYMDARIIIGCEDYLLKKQREINGQTQPLIKKLKWLGSASMFGYIFNELADKNYIEVPLNNKKDWSPKRYAEALLQLFEVEGETGSIINTFYPDKNKLSEFTKKSIKISNNKPDTE